MTPFSSRCLQMPPAASRCLQLPPADVSRCLQMPTDAFRCLQMPPDAKEHLKALFGVSRQGHAFDHKPLTTCL